MSDHKKLPWGEKHLCGMYFTVKVRVGLPLWDAFDHKMHHIDGLSCYATYKKGTAVHNGYILFGVLHNDEYQKYLNIKQNAQAKLLINKAANLLNQVKDRKLFNHDEKGEGVRLVEPITLG